LSFSISRESTAGVCSVYTTTTTSPRTRQTREHARHAARGPLVALAECAVPRCARRRGRLATVPRVIVRCHGAGSRFGRARSGRVGNLPYRPLLRCVRRDGWPNAPSVGRGIPGTNRGACHRLAICGRNALHGPSGFVSDSLVCAYFALVHISVLKRATAHGEKELLVGLLFATGVAVPLLAEHPEPSSWFASVVGFGLVCWLNCRLIDRWEEGMAGGDIQSLVIALAAALCAEAAPLVVGSAIAACTGLLILLHLVHQRIGPRPARVLADVAMFTPVAAWCFS
jgi:hypothetical protein